MLRVENLTVKFGELTIVNNISFSLEEKQWLMISGPNGAGKSTLIDAISLGTPYSGKVYYEGNDILQFKPGQLAQRMGVLMQNHHVSYSFTVEEVVRLGRYAYSHGIFSSGSDEDDEKVTEALALTGMTAMRNQSVLSLSGGELQRTFLAQLLAQNPRILLLDEPSNHLDLVYQKQVFGLIRDWLTTNGRAVISVVHDLSLAKAYGSHAMLLSKGCLHAFGKVAEVLNPENLNQVYQMDVYQWQRQMLSQWDAVETGSPECLGPES